MAGDRIDNFSEAKRLDREYREQDVIEFLPETVSYGNIRHGVTGEGLDGIEADFATLRQAEREFANLYDDLLVHLRDASELTQPMSDGTSPVTGPMRKAFRDRADMEGGVQTALLDYMEELIAVRTAILQTLATYEGVEGDTFERLREQARELEELS